MYNESERRFSMEKILSDSLKQEFLALKPSDITLNYLITNFGYRGQLKNGKLVTIEPKFHSGYKVHLRAGEYINKKEIDTNCGIILFNKIFVEEDLVELIPDGFYNEVLDKKKLNKFLGIISDAVRAKKIQINPTYVKFLKNYEFWGLIAVSIFSPSYDMNIIKPNEKVMKEKEKLLRNVGEISDVNKMVEIEDQLVSLAKNELKDDPSFPLYASGARGSFDNDYKNISMALGPVQNLITGEYKYVKHNYIDGMEREDLVSMGNALVAAEYPKAVGTQKSGYETKKFYGLFQDVTLDKPGTDCHTKVTLDIVLTARNARGYMYQYIMENGKAIRLDDDTIDQYIGKLVHLRSYMFCTNPSSCCSICAGTRYYDLEMENPGLTAGKISNGLLNKRMKIRHSSKIELYRVNTETLLMGTKDGTKYFVTDNDSVYMNSPYAEAYIPEALFQDADEDTESIIYRADGNGFKCIGLFNMRFFDKEDYNREAGKLYTLSFPTGIFTFPSSSTTETITINGVTDKFRVFHYEKGDLMMSAVGQQNPLNCEVYIKLLLSGKLPNTLDYPDVFKLWDINFDINGYDPGVPEILKQMIVAKLYRDKKDYTREFRMSAGTGKVKMTDYITMSPREITANSSVLAGLAFEDFTNALNSGLLMSKRGTSQKKSPVEEVIFN